MHSYSLMFAHTNPITFDGLRSVNEVICHGIPDSRPLVNGDIVNLDISIFTAEGFHADLNETFIVGSVDEKTRRLVKCVGPSHTFLCTVHDAHLLSLVPFNCRTAYECLRAAVAVCRPGVMYRDLGTVISRVVGEAGFSIVKSYCGHGIGRMFHCAPNVPHYAKNKAVGMMKKG